MAPGFPSRGYAVATQLAPERRKAALPVRITKRLVDATEADAAREVWAWDVELRGFGLRVQPSGHKSYVLEYRPGAGGRSAPKRRLTIGRHGSPWTPETARREAERILGLVAAGADPAANKATLRGGPTVAEFGERWLVDHVEKKRKPATAKLYRDLAERLVYPALGRRKVAEVTRQDVARLHTSLRETPYQANRCLAIVSALFNYAELMGERPQASNPARKVERFDEQARERLLSPFELGCIGEALRRAEAAAAEQERAVEALQAAQERLAAAEARGAGREAREARAAVTAGRARLREIGRGVIPLQMIAYVRLLMFTGARSSEILGLRWAWVDLERAELRLPDSKTGRKTVHLAPPAVEVLDALPRLDGNPFVIFGERGDAKHFVGVHKPWGRILDAASVVAWSSEGSETAEIVAGLEGRLGRVPTAEECREAAEREGVELPEPFAGLRLHDLRHAFASVAAGSGLGLPIIGKLLGHTQAATTNRYAHLAADPLKAAAAGIAGSIADAMAGGVK